MRVVIAGVTLVASACSFESKIDAQLVGIDANGAEMMATSGSEALPTIAPCRTPDASGLVVCLEFEDKLDDGTLDDSSPARRSVATSGLAQVTGHTTMAADVGTNASTYVAQDAGLDLPSAYTFAVWVKPDVLPAPNSALGVLDREGQYAMIVSANGGGDMYNRCQHTNVAKYEYTTRLTAGAWQLLACTFDGTRLCAWRWASASDNERFCHDVSIQPMPSGTHGLAVGHLSAAGAAHARFDGALDSVQVYNRAMTEPQLCALIGQPAGCMPCDGGTCL